MVLKTKLNVNDNSIEHGKYTSGHIFSRLFALNSEVMQKLISGFRFVLSTLAETEANPESRRICESKCGLVLHMSCRGVVLWSV